MFESYFKQVKYILGSKDGKDKKIGEDRAADWTG